MVALKSFSNPPAGRPNRRPRANRNRLRVVQSPTRASQTPSYTINSTATPAPSSQRQVVAPSYPNPGQKRSPTARPQNVQRLQSRSLPRGVRNLQLFEKALSLCTLGLGAATIAIYSLTVQTQQSWMAEYNELQNLERYERQLVTASEILKNRMAEQAETAETNLVRQNQYTTIFLDPIQQRSPTAPASEPVLPLNDTPSRMPLGY
ncbi:hypothetical protein [Roseofilum casamattae]|uniref:Cell division protein FtsL n=1 Tax=Roseofilum casamattae BLCC-M143 TaxID=3022442 RepID=A0ABT7BTU6_9CYAN|nr:hypothetical protein [Roseofilum casamattae]MDJ1182604.1 hypothetical protein [Roseofilum casamattae BLCC-M143]